ncbi:hypothetical protein Ccur_10610 [Cryptobacterium curtum DSM 15641]|uniref:Uncharacterized protein n=1 Tax=Cryptobacterium curtum (strain ATCC 700683 / DSM 15641 / CCUG 43107 / 12-3) TaxID=469378 RepID=C7MPB2_CRYCD|nr:hypothetical protein [Cryptobacterium curtum]ACU94752.1 hypothetical protein Ccur_10610 [Cryptobacterium curtum DSM 15641]
MAYSKAQGRASAKYNKEKTITKTIRFSHHELDVVKYLEAQPNMSGYIKSLIRTDMNRTAH